MFRNRTEIMRSRSAEEIVDLFASELNESVARFASDLFVHAGVVGWRGKAIVMPGLSMSGKSTLVAELIQQGASYYSDEYAVIGEDGWIIHSYPKPLSIRRPRNRPLHLSAKSLGGKVGRNRLAVGLIVVTAFRSGAQWKPRPLSEAESMIALIANTVMARARPEMTMQRLARAVQGMLGLRARGEMQGGSASTNATRRSAIPANGLSCNTCIKSGLCGDAPLNRAMIANARKSSSCAQSGTYCLRRSVRKQSSDRNSQKAHRLNRSATIVWRHAEWKDIGRRVGRNAQRELQLAQPVQPLMRNTLQKVASSGLLEGRSGVTRRSAGRKICRRCSRHSHRGYHNSPSARASRVHTLQ